MTRIILHIGPEKCGSTSIQQSVAKGGEDHHSLLLDPYLLIGLDHAEPDSNAIAALTRQIDTKLSHAPNKALVVSHEMIFKSQPMLRVMAKICTRLSDHVEAIMYVRRQSDFAVSGFGQWHFRSPERLREARAVLDNHAIDASVLYGVERHLIAGLLGNWRVFRQPSGHLYLNWHSSVAEAQETLAAYDVALSVGVLPRAGFDGDLVGDFLHRAHLKSLGHTDIEATKNQSFHAALIEATVNAIEAGFDMPGPHEANDFFAKMGQLKFGELVHDDLLATLKSHIDHAFWDQNQKFAACYDHPSAYFVPDMNVMDRAVEHSVRAAQRRRQKLGRTSFSDAEQTRAKLVYAAWRSRTASRHAPK